MSLALFDTFSVSLRWSVMRREMERRRETHASRNRINIAAMERRTSRRLTLVIRVTHGKITLFPFRKEATCAFSPSPPPSPFCLASCPPGPRKPAAVTIPAHFPTLPPPPLSFSLLFFRSLPSVAFCSTRELSRPPNPCPEPVHLQSEKFFSSVSIYGSFAVCLCSE